jgi:hypothetical protein
MIDNSISKNLISLKLLLLLVVTSFFLIGSKIELNQLDIGFVKIDIFPSALAKDDNKAEKAAKKEAKK